MTETKAKTSIVNVRMDGDIKEKSASVLAEHGLSVSDAVRILLTRIVRENRVPSFLFMDDKSYDEWFRAKVREALEDERDSIPHEEVMAGLRAKLCASSEEKASS